MAKYKLGLNGMIIDNETGGFIPPTVENAQYQRYLEWVDDGNTADPADVIDPWIAGRAERNAKLAASDWTQFNDSPLQPSEQADWATYRQELRDLPATYPDFGDVVWPTEPA